MADQQRTRENSGTRAKAWAAEVDAARRRAGLLLRDGLADYASGLGRLTSVWALAEVAPGRLMPCSPWPMASASSSISPPIASGPGGQP